VHSDTYAIPAQLPWSAFAGSLERAEDAVARLDERVRHHPLAEGWAERAHFAEACARNRHGEPPSFATLNQTRFALKTRPSHSLRDLVVRREIGRR